ncbi:sensor domain-containing diguanylate cyclase [Syntrophomonas palmitatica]|uniref:sensor domain-containing diguanylate cyclase n=1 Tax=Syntrophomonas palmitatica TaxID=402877 RepID=UPI0006CFB1AE|nr:sensor domain-containing diguanylate cyclase [Syntrophomonas palmitatica]
MRELLRQFRLVIIGLLTLLALCFIIIFYPVQEKMQSDAQDNFRTEARISLTSLNHFVTRCSAETFALTQRQEPLRKLTSYKKGHINRSEMFYDTLSCYNETCQYIENLVQAVRTTDKSIVYSYGDAIIPYSDLLSNQPKQLRVKLYKHHHHSYFLVSCPIKHGQDILGYDHLLFDPAPLLYDVSSKDYDYQLVSQADFNIERHSDVRIGNELYACKTYTCFYKGIKNSDAALLVKVSDNVLYQQEKGVTYFMIAVIATALLTTLLLLYFSIYRTARKLVLRLESYNSNLELEKGKVEKLASGQRDLFNIFRSLSECQTLDDDFRVLQSSLHYIINYRNFLIAVRCSKNAGSFEIKEVTGDFAHFNPGGLFTGKNGILEEVIITGQSCFTGDLPADHLPGVYRRDVNSLIVVPISYKGFKWGLIAVDHLDKHAFNKLDLELMEMLASHLALHLEEMEAKRSLNFHAYRLRYLHEMVSSLVLDNSNINAMHFLEELFSSVEFLSLAVYDSRHLPAGTDFELVFSSGLQEYLPKPDIQGELFQNLLYSRSPQVQQIDADGVFRLICPVAYGDVLYGVFCVVKRDAFYDEDLDIIWIIANYIAIFKELDLLIEKIEQETLIDPLTSVWNRRYIMKQIEIENDKLKRSGGECSIAIVDLGNFKTINDEFGHIAGDEVLKYIAATIASFIRTSDYVGRYGGDEFIVLLPGSTPEQADNILRRINTELGKQKPAGIEAEIFADYGIASCPQDTASLFDAIQIADKRMYLNKNSRKQTEEK